MSLPRVLSVIFPSNSPNHAADSIVTFNRALLGRIAAAQRWDVHIAGPPGLCAPHPAVTMHAFDTGVTKLEVRFGFPWKELAGILRQVQPQVILVNMPEQAAAIAMLAREELRQSRKIVSYVHYVPATMGMDGDVLYEDGMNDNGLGGVTVARLIEGLAASDLVLTCSQFAIGLLHELAKTLCPGLVLPSFSTLPPPVDFREVQNHHQHAGTRVRPTIVYNHRLYGAYGTRRIFELLERLSSNLNFTVVVTNPTHGRDLRRARLSLDVDGQLAYLESLPFTEIRHFHDRRSYYGELERCWVGLGPYKLNALWSMSIVDMLAVDRPVVAFDVGGVREIGIPTSRLATTDEEFEHALLRDLEEPPRPGARFRSIAERYDAEVVAQQLNGYLESVL